MPPLNPPKRLQNVVEVIDLDPPPRKKTLRLPAEKRWKVLETREEAHDRYRAEALKELEEDRRQFETSIGLEPTASPQQFGEAVARSSSSSSSSSSNNDIVYLWQQIEQQHQREVYFLNKAKESRAKKLKAEAEDFFREGRT